MTSNGKIASEINAKIIDIILASPLNIQFIPDDVERAMYMEILTAVETYVQQPSFQRKVLTALGDTFTSCYSWIRNKVSILRV